MGKTNEIHDMIQQTKSSDGIDRILDILIKINERMDELEAKIISLSYDGDE